MEDVVLCNCFLIIELQRLYVVVLIIYKTIIEKGQLPLELL